MKENLTKALYHLREHQYKNNLPSWTPPIEKNENLLEEVITSSVVECYFEMLLNSNYNQSIEFKPDVRNFLQKRIDVLKNSFDDELIFERMIHLNVDVLERIGFKSKEGEIYLCYMEQARIFFDNLVEKD
eukprot:TRINITY_DN6144_c0_g1_i2.p1 TRINITY_DN6144_c0_g1~~TRINITY_DN6144_c0_g1_i2.p1  ORF type:complete len:130 (-),score=29.81 TRINITY_DN6144_c0_g1_i2:71-460(-)